jgi:hypothetical protein
MYELMAYYAFYPQEARFGKVVTDSNCRWMVSSQGYGSITLKKRNHP